MIPESIKLGYHSILAACWVFARYALLGIRFFSLNVKACCLVNKEQNLVVIKESFFFLIMG